MNDMLRMELGGKRLLINLLKISLLAFTGFRTYHFLTTTLPSDAFIVAIFGLAAIDLGVVLWESYYNHGALSAEQETIAGGMIILDLIGMACAFAGDVLLIRTDVVAPTWLPTVALFGVIGVVIGNVVGGVGVSVFDPEARIARARRRAAYAGQLLELNIEQEKAKTLLGTAQSLAGELVPDAAEHVRNQVRAQYMFVRPVKGANGVNGSEPLPPFGTIQTPPRTADSGTSPMDGNAR